MGSTKVERWAAETAVFFESESEREWVETEVEETGDYLEAWVGWDRGRLVLLRVVSLFHSFVDNFLLFISCDLVVLEV